MIRGPHGITEIKVFSPQRMREREGNLRGRKVKDRAGNSLICSSLILSSLIRSFRSNQMSNCERFPQIEWPWANRSGCSEEMSDLERIAQLAQDKWVTLRDSLRSLRGNERMSDWLNKFWLKKSKILFYYLCFIYDKKKNWKNNRITHFLFLGEWYEWIAQVAERDEGGGMRGKGLVMRGEVLGKREETKSDRKEVRE